MRCYNTSALPMVEQHFNRFTRAALRRLVVAHQRRQRSYRAVQAGADCAPQLAHDGADAASGARGGSVPCVADDQARSALHAASAQHVSPACVAACTSVSSAGSARAAASCSGVQCGPDALKRAANASHAATASVGVPLPIFSSAATHARRAASSWAPPAADAIVWPAG